MEEEQHSLVVTTRIDEEQRALFTIFLEQHGCVVEDQGDFLRVHFPEGTRRQAALSGRDERHTIILPDATHLVEVYIRHKEYTILNIPAGEAGREARERRWSRAQASGAPTRNKVDRPGGLVGESGIWHFV